MPSRICRSRRKMARMHTPTAEILRPAELINQSAYACALPTTKQLYSRLSGACGGAKSWQLAGELSAGTLYAHRCIADRLPSAVQHLRNAEFD